ncbi:MAG: DUF6770 family protein [Bacteroidota bacterium]
MRHILIIAACLLLVIGDARQAVAQTQTFSGIDRLNARSVGTIKENNTVVGYYSFYRLDKVAKGTFTFLLQVVDGELNNAFKTTITRSKFHFLQEVVYNGKAYAMLFYNTKTRELELTTFSKEGKEIASSTYEALTRKEVLLYQTQGFLSVEEAGSNKSIFPVGDEGFVRMAFQRDSRKTGYTLEYFPNDLKKANRWKIGSKPDHPLHETAIVNSVSPSAVSLSVTRAKGAMSKVYSSFVQAIDLKERKVAYEIPLSTKDFTHSVVLGEYDETTGQTLVMGNYFRPEDKKMKSKNLGMFAWLVDSEGGVPIKKYYSWGKDIAKFLPVNQKGKMQDAGYIFMHQIVKADDGRMYVIGEEYKKEVSGAGVALNLLAAAGGSASGAANFKIVLQDFVVFEIAPDFSLTDVQIFEKKKNNVLLPAGFGYLSVASLGRVVKLYNGFDYAYTEELSGENAFYFTYFSRAKQENSKGKMKVKPVFGVISNDGEEYQSDKVNIDTDAYLQFIRAGKPGFYTVWEYSKKTKTLKARLEQVNY